MLNEGASNVGDYFHAQLKLFEFMPASFGNEGGQSEVGSDISAQFFGSLKKIPSISVPYVHL